MDDRNLVWKISFAAVIIFVLFSSVSCKKSEKGIYTESDGTITQTGGTVNMSGKTFTSSTDDVSAITVSGGTMNISNSKISSSGNTTSLDSSKVYGLNSVFCSYPSSGSITVNSSKNIITSTGIGANGLFSYGAATITSTGDRFNQSGDYSHSVLCSYLAIMTIENDTAVTSGMYASTIVADSSEGSISITGGVYTANGKNSAAVVSKGTVSFTNATVTSNGYEAVVVDGANKATFTDCKVTTNNNSCGAMIYSSVPGYGEIMNGYLIMTQGSLTYTGTTGGLFYNTNSTGYFTLDTVTVSNNCDTLVKCVEGSWSGFSASDGGEAYLTVNDVTISGLVYIDGYSIGHVTLLNSTAYTGAINSGNIAKQVSLIIDCSSTWSLTADSYIKGQIKDACISGSSVSNIKGNGFNVYYSLTDNPAFGGQTFTLVNGGELIPKDYGEEV